MSSAARRAKTTLPLREVFARNVRSVRIHNGQSQERLADDAHLDRTFVSSLERGVRNISIDNIEVLANALHWPAHELLDPDLAQREGFDTTLTRAARVARPYAAGRRAR